MKKLICILTVCSIFTFAYSQKEIDWNFQYNQKLNQIEMTAKLADSWHLYSQYIARDIGPVPTQFVFQSNDNFQLVGKTEEPEPIKRYDQAFEAELTFFEKQVTFSQKIKQNSEATLKGTVSFMLCNDEMCLPPEEKQFEITIHK